jgi:CheY-like chemotaxis protein
VENKDTVLVVEDDHDLRALTLDLLDAEGYTVVGARHGREATALILAGLRPDLVVLDLRMPLMTGPELLRWLRGHPSLRVVPVLVVSTRDRRRAALEHEVQGWVQKPSSATELLATIARLCADRRSAERRRSGSGIRTAV